MSAKRFTGKTESDAVMNAAMELGIPSTDLKYTVIDSGSNGLKLTAFLNSRYVSNPTLFDTSVTNFILSLSSFFYIICFSS